MKRICGCIYTYTYMYAHKITQYQKEKCENIHMKLPEIIILGGAKILYIPP
jgi:hypothetical protein